MKSFLIFISAVLLTYGGINLYIYHRFMQAASLDGWVLWTARVVLIGLILSFPLGRALESTNGVGATLTWIGALWLGVMLYAMLAAVLFDILHVLDFLLGWFPDALISNRAQTGRMILAVVTVITLLIMIGGRINAMNPQIRDVALQLDGLPPRDNEYHVIMVSDLHLGVLVGEKPLRSIVNRINTLKPDLCLLVGDVVDEPPEQVSWAVDVLAELNAADGTYAVTGNHEYYSGVAQFYEMMKKAGIVVLDNRMVRIDETLVLAGLNDATGGGQYGADFKPVAEVLQDAGDSLPVILMHHTPTRMTEAAEAGVDLMLSGHSHGGQLFPFGWVTRILFGVKQGLTDFGDMKFFLSNGAGTWGPPVRVGARPEIVHFILTSSGDGGKVDDRN